MRVHVGVRSTLLTALVLLAVPGAAARASTPVGGSELDQFPEGSLTRIIAVTEPEDLSVDDPLYPMLTFVADLRAQAQAAIENAENAEQAARDARVALTAAKFESTVSAVRAEHAQRLVNRWAADLYRGEIGNDDGLLLVTRVLDDPSMMLDIKVWFAAAAANRQAHLRLAAALKLNAETIAAKTENLAQVAHTRAAEATTARNDATALLETIETSLEMLLGQTVSYQIIIGPDGCPQQVPEGTLRGAAAGLDVAELCARSVASAPTVEAALAIKYAFRALGGEYACEGIGRWEPFRYDCSSLVSRAYAEGAGLPTASQDWIPTTRDLLPWDGHRKLDWSVPVEPVDARPGDLVLYDMGLVTSRHVALLLSDELILHVADCGDVVHVTDFPGFADANGRIFLGVRRVDPNLARSANVDLVARGDSQGFGADVPWLSDGTGVDETLLGRPIYENFDRSQRRGPRS